jgi:hypothetical protein
MDNTASNKQFISELADLLDKHNLALCSKREGEYTSVFFMSAITDGDNANRFGNGRCHSTAYEFRGWCETMRTPPEKAIAKILSKHNIEFTESELTAMTSDIEKDVAGVLMQKST